MKGKSCTTNLLKFLDKVTEAADKGKNIDIIYLDFAKAFNKVPTARLLKKVEAHELLGKCENSQRPGLQTGNNESV